MSLEARILQIKEATQDDSVSPALVGGVIEDVNGKFSTRVDPLITFDVLNRFVTDGRLRLDVFHVGLELELVDITFVDGNGQLLSDSVVRLNKKGNGFNYNFNSDNYLFRDFHTSVLTYDVTLPTKSDGKPVNEVDNDVESPFVYGIVKCRLVNSDKYFYKIVIVPTFRVLPEE